MREYKPKSTRLNWLILVGLAQPSQATNPRSPHYSLQVYGAVENQAAASWIHGTVVHLLCIVPRTREDFFITSISIFFLLGMVSFSLTKKGLIQLGPGTYPSLFGYQNLLLPSLWSRLCWFCSALPSSSDSSKGRVFMLALPLSGIATSMNSFLEHFLIQSL